MKNKIKVCIMRDAGVNCDRETNYVFGLLGADSEVVHLNEFISKSKNINDYNILVFPGGFSHSDHIRAGVIFAKKLNAYLKQDLERFTQNKKPIIGICNGFQILLESGLLPGFDNIIQTQEAGLAKNEKLKFESRFVNLINANKGKCIFTKNIPNNILLKMPIAHGEGNFKISNENLKKLIENDQIVFKYADESGKPANQKYPINPNGSVNDIAAICNSNGTILGIMPHPERAFDKSLGSDAGLIIFKNAIDYCTKKF